MTLIPGRDSFKTKRAIIVGGGITGLTCAYELMQMCPMMSVHVLEKETRSGGVIKTLRQDDLLIECGPESFSTLKSEVVSLASRLNISDQIISTSPNNRRSYLSIGGKLRALPDGLMMIAPSNLCSFAKSSIFSMAGKVRMAMETLIPAKSAHEEDESLSKFVRRRLGQEALDKLAEPMIGGIYGGDTELLSAKSTIPQLVELENKHGSIIKGLIKARQSGHHADCAGPRYSTLASFDKGISVITENLVKQLPQGCILTSKYATEISPGRNGTRWTVYCSDGSYYNADYVILCTPAQHSANLLKSINPSLSEKLSRIHRSPAVIINLVYELAQVGHSLDGFGFVVPRSEGLIISACSFSSVKFGGRAGGDKLLVRLFTGGTLKSYVMQMSEHELMLRCHNELRDLLNVQSEPLMHVISRYDAAIPQYNVGHTQLVSEIRQDLLMSHGIELAGNSFAGVGLPDCIRSARDAASRISELALNVSIA